MIKKEKITISLDANLLAKIDERIDKLNFKSRSNVIENFVKEGLRLKNDIEALIIANDDNWNDGKYPLEIPKILIKVDGKTLLEKHIEMLENANVENVILALGHEKEQVKQFLRKKRFDINIRLLDVNKDDKTEKILEIAKKFTSQNKLIVILGDNYHNNFNLLDFIYYHNTFGTSLSIAVKSQEVSKGYGNIKLAGNDIVKFVEKPSVKEDITYIVNAGIYIMEENIIPETGRNLKLEVDFFPDFVASNKVKAYFHNGNWFHMQSNEVLGKV